MPRLDRARCEQLVASARVGRLATVDRHGRPHLVPLCFAVLADTIYSAVDHKPKQSTSLRRLRNIADTGRACVLIDEYAEDWTVLWWVRVDGPARVVTAEGEAVRAVGALQQKYPQYQQVPPHGSLIALDIERLTGWTASAA